MPGTEPVRRGRSWGGGSGRVGSQAVGGLAGWRENEEKVEVRKMGRGYGWGTTR